MESNRKPLQVQLLQYGLKNIILDPVIYNCLSMHSANQLGNHTLIYNLKLNI